MNNFDRELTKEQWEQYQRGELTKYDVFSENAIMGYGASIGSAYEKDGKYYVHCSMSNSCD